MNTSYFSVSNFSDFLILGPEHPSSKQHGRRCGCPSCTGKIIDSAAKKYSKLYNLTSFPARTDLAPTNPSPYVNGLLSGTKWGSSGYNPTSTTDLKYYIYDNETLGVDLGSDGINDTGLALDSSGKEKTAIENAMAAYSSVSGLTFAETTDKTEANISWALLNNAESGGAGTLGFAFLPGSSLGTSFTTINQESYNLSTDTNAIDQGSYFYITYTHELGHSLGLKHPHDVENATAGTFNVFPGVTADDDGGDNELNSTPWTVMTYNDITATNGLTPGSTANNGYLMNLGAFDIAAIQYLYGPNLSTNSTDTTYTLDSSLTGYKTIWDAGGTDLIDASSLSTAVSIDLRNATLNQAVGGGGFASKIDSVQKGYVIAYDSTGSAIIENATGGSGADTLTGNDSANTLNGGTGDDTLKGNGGADVFQMSAGTDVVQDFTSETDKVEITSGLTYTLTDVGSDMIIATSDGAAIKLEGINTTGFKTSTDISTTFKSHEFTDEYLEGLLGGAADLNGNGNTTDTGTAPDLSSYADGDDYLVTGTLVGAGALTGAKQALDGFNTNQGITFTTGAYKYANLKGSAS